MSDNILIILHYFGARSVFYYFVITKRLSCIYNKQKLLKLDLYSPQKYIKGSMGQ